MCGQFWLVWKFQPQGRNRTLSRILDLATLTGVLENVLRGGLNGSADTDDASVSVADGAAAAVVPGAVDQRPTADVEVGRRVGRGGVWRRWRGRLLRCCWSAAPLQFQAVLKNIGAEFEYLSEGLVDQEHFYAFSWQNLPLTWHKNKADSPKFQ